MSTGLTTLEWVVFAALGALLVSWPRLVEIARHPLARWRVRGARRSTVPRSSVPATPWQLIAHGAARWDDRTEAYIRARLDR
jgi:hypothetical protein